MKDQAAPRYSMRGLEWRKTAFFLLFLLYFLVASIGMNFSKKLEYFPVFSWSLFTYVWDTSWGWELEIARVDDHVFNPPKNYYLLGNYFPGARSRDIGLTKLLSFYQAARKNDPDRAAALRKVLEDRYLAGPARVDYRIVLVTANVLDRWRTGGSPARSSAEPCWRSSAPGAGDDSEQRPPAPGDPDPARSVRLRPALGPA